jgi:hypothetical protein
MSPYDQYTKEDVQHLKSIINSTSYRALSILEDTLIKRNNPIDTIPELLEAFKKELSTMDISPAYIEGVAKILSIPLEEVPLHINAQKELYKLTAQWRLKIGK